MKLIFLAINQLIDFLEEDKEFIATLKDVKIKKKELKNIEKQEFKELRQDLRKFMVRNSKCYQFLTKQEYICNKQIFMMVTNTIVIAN